MKISGETCVWRRRVVPNGQSNERIGACGFVLAKHKGNRKLVDNEPSDCAINPARMISGRHEGIQFPVTGVAD